MHLSMIFIIYSVSVEYHLYQFAYIDLSLYLRDKSWLIMVYGTFNVLLNLIC